MIIEVLILSVYALLTLVALFALRQSRLTGLPQFLWALLVIMIPVLGALAFLIVNPAKNIQA